MTVLAENGAVLSDSPLELPYNFDDIENIAWSDDVESERTAWTPSNPELWSRQRDAENHVWHGASAGDTVSAALVSPELELQDDIPFVIELDHRYSFESWMDYMEDGGVIELTDDGGETWHDLAEYGDPGYTGTITAAEKWDPSSLAGRDAFVGNSPEYPSYVHTSIDLGNALHGKTIKLRFRIGTNTSVSLPGWDIDNIRFGTERVSSLVNRPFAAVLPNTKDCSH